jgi:hypothetical protein
VFRSFKALWVKVTLGDLNRNTIESTEVTMFGKAVTHLSYSYDKAGTIRNDIGLVRLNKDVSYSANIQPIALPNAVVGTPAEGSTVDILGWGIYSTKTGANKIGNTKWFPHNLISLPALYISILNYQ